MFEKKATQSQLNDLQIKLALSEYAVEGILENQHKAIRSNTINIVILIAILYVLIFLLIRRGVITFDFFK